MFDESFYYTLPKGTERLDYLKKCIAEADNENDHRLSLELRYRYIEHSIFHDDNFRAIIMFPEFMAMFEKYPDELEPLKFMRAFKWVVEDSCDYYQITREQAEGYFEKFREYCLRFGYTERTCYLKKMEFYKTVDRELAIECYKKYPTFDRTDLSDCAACEESAGAKFELEFGSERRAVEMLGSMIERNVTCGEVPETTYMDFCDHFAREGRYDEAGYYADLMMPLIKGDEENFFEAIAVAVRAYTFIDLQRAYDLVAANTMRFFRIKNPKTKFHFADAAARFFRRAAETGAEVLRVPMPKDSGLEENEDGTPTGALERYFFSAAKDLADKFDARNGNSIFNGLLSFAYPDAPVTELDLPIHGKIRTVPLTIGVPYGSSESLPHPQLICDIIKDLEGCEDVTISKDDEEPFLYFIPRTKDGGSLPEYAVTVQKLDPEISESMAPYGIFPENAIEELISEERTCMFFSLRAEDRAVGMAMHKLIKLCSQVNTEESPVLLDMSHKRFLPAAFALQ
ncbi:MAG: hypothetical protein IJ806_04025 [Ruminococcus sp.]|nr:hypothetical protein [Ruminococcus sp.]